MAKTIRKTIQITTRKRNNSIKINEEFYSYDKNNAQFEFIMDYDVPADKVIALFHFENSNRYYETLCQFKGNLITIDFDTTLIVEDELVTGYLYFDKLDKSTDVYRFTFGVRVSEIDKTRELPVQEKVSRRIVPVADIVTKQELKELMDRIQKNGGTYDDTEIRNSISSISERVQTLGNNDSDVKSRLSALESNASKYLTEHQPLTRIEERIQQVEARFNNLSNIYLSSHQSLEHLATNEALGKIEQRVEQLEQNRGNTPTVDSSNFITRQELEGKHYLASVPEELTNKMSALDTKVQTLENKSVVTHEELESAGYLKEHQPLTDYATNSKVEAVESRVLALENKPAVVPQGYDDSGLKQRITNLENRPQVDLTDYAKKSEIVAPTLSLMGNTLSISGGNSVALPLNDNANSQIKGSGNPENKVVADPGTLYVNQSVFLGDYLYYKVRNPGRNSGWAVLYGQMGINSNLYTGEKLRVDRVNNTVNVLISDLTINLDKLKNGYGSDFAQTGQHVTIRLTPAKKFDARETVIPVGFRPNGNFQVPAYKKTGEEIGVFKFERTYGVVKLILFNVNLSDITQDMLRGINSGLIMYITPDQWPTTLI